MFQLLFYFSTNVANFAALNQLSYGMQFQGKHIRVDMATAPRKEGAVGTSNAAEYDRTRSIFLGNVPFDVEVWDFLFLF